LLLHFNAAEKLSGNPPLYTPALAGSAATGCAIDTLDATVDDRVIPGSNLGMFRRVVVASRPEQRNVAKWHRCYGCTYLITPLVTPSGSGKGIDMRDKGSADAVPMPPFLCLDGKGTGVI